MWAREFLLRTTMTNSCPECGTSMDFEQREVRLRTGTCPSCAKEFAFVEGTTVSSRLGTPPSGPASPSGEGAPTSEGVEGGPECDECGSLLSFREGKGGSLEVVCADCETTTVFVPKRESTRPERERERERPEGFDAGAPRSRPCPEVRSAPAVLHGRRRHARRGMRGVRESVHFAPPQRQWGRRSRRPRRTAVRTTRFPVRSRVSASLSKPGRRPRWPPVPRVGPAWASSI